MQDKGVQDKGVQDKEVQDKEVQDKEVQDKEVQDKEVIAGSAARQAAINYQHHYHHQQHQHQQHRRGAPRAPPETSGTRPLPARGEGRAGQQRMSRRRAACRRLLAFSSWVFAERIVGCVQRASAATIFAPSESSPPTAWG